jgi:hypothetical protein
MSLALEAAGRVSHPAIDGRLGTFLLGATSPDIRIMTKWGRDQTHFAPLSIERIGAGVEGLFQRHPTLSHPTEDGVNEATKVFLAGYFTHLVADEAWILEIYRTFFGGQRPAEDRVQGNIWDRALQLDMDMAACREMGGMEQVRHTLEGAELGVEVGFISPETLGQWRDWVCNFTTREYTWERLRSATRRMYKEDPQATALVEEFLQCVPGGLERVYSLVPAEKIAEYREKVVGESMRLIKEYLGVPEGDQGPG